MTKLNRYFLFIFSLSLFGGYAHAQKLYFCEEYKDGKEIAVSDVFTIKSNGGYFTCMLDLRDAGKKIGTTKIVLRIVKNENNSEKFVADEKFDVDADWDYIYFDKFHTFYEAGKYKVTALKPDDTPVASGEVTIEMSMSGDDTKLNTGSGSTVYFCEKYEHTEIGISNVFYVDVVSGGTFTAMLDTRGSGVTLKTDKITLKIYKLRGNTETFVADEDFDVNSDWDYVYFSDFHNFKSAGVYRVKAVKPDGTVVAFGDVSVRVR